MKQPATALLLICSLAAQAGHLEDGLRHLDAKAYAQASLSFRAAAAEGNAAAERQIGFMYYRGTGQTQSNTEAVSWFERAAAHGDLQSQINLGQMYENGLSVPQSNERSAYWYRMAAEQGDRSSQFRLGEICYLGEGVPKDRAEAVKWWRVATRIDDDTTARMRPTIDPVLHKIDREALGEGQRRADAWLAAKSTSR